MKTKLCILLLAVAICGCKKKSTSDDINPDIAPVEKKYRIKEVNYFYSTGNEKVNYEYNDKSQISKITYGDGSKNLFTYNATGKLIKAESIENVILSHNYSIVYSYDNAGIKLEQIQTATSSGSKNKTTYTISNGVTTGFKYYTWNNTNNTWLIDSNNIATYVLDSQNRIIRQNYKNRYSLSAYDERGNIITRKSFEKKSTNPNSYYMYFMSNRMFDDKKFIFDSPDAPTYKVNNLLEQTYTYYLENGNIDNQQTSTLSYEYNEAGYVTKQFYNGSLNAIFTLEEVK
jgi:hypothetical protein